MIQQSKSSLIKSAKDRLYSLLIQSALVFSGLMVMLIFTGGMPTGGTVTLSFVLGITWVAWTEAKRLSNEKLKRQYSKPETKPTPTPIRKQTLSTKRESVLAKRLFSRDEYPFLMNVFVDAQIHFSYEIFKEIKQHKGGFENKNFEKANLKEANLENINLRGINLRGANLRGANLRGANLRGAILCGAILSGAILSGAILEGAYLFRATLIHADLSGADLRRANFIEADLQGADLRRANLIEAKLEGANIKYAVFTNTTGLTKERIGYLKLRGAIFEHSQEPE